MVRADFNFFTINAHLGDKVGDLNVPWATFYGNQTPVMYFHIEGVPTDDAYLLMQAFDVHSGGHRVLINGQDLSGFDIPPEPNGWQTWMDAIDRSLLHQGINTLQIKRASGGDNFVIANVAVHWRERD